MAIFLPREVRSVLTNAGVLARPRLPAEPAPTLPKLLASIAKRGGVVTLRGEAGEAYEATVALGTVDGFDAADDDPTVAVATAYAAALRAQPQQTRLAD